MGDLRPHCASPTAQLQLLLVRSTDPEALAIGLEAGLALAEGSPNSFCRVFRLVLLIWQYRGKRDLSIHIVAASHKA